MFPNSPPEKNSHQTIVVGQSLVYKDLTAGVVGSVFVVVEAVFDDNNTGIITYASIQFN